MFLSNKKTYLKHRRKSEQGSYLKTVRYMLNIYEYKTKQKFPQFHLGQLRETNSVTKIIRSLRITFSISKKWIKLFVISCLSAFKSTRCLELAILKCKVDSDKMGRNVFLEVYITDL